ncbi:ABC transporter, partial [Tyzzerella nexilis]|nr:ABC transporter [[Clostridium] nexile]
PNLIYCIYPLVIKMLGTAYLRVDYAAILMCFILGCVYIAIGMFLSALTDSQIIAAVSTFAVLLILHRWG